MVRTERRHRLTEQFATAGQAHSVYVVDQRAYVAAYDGGLQVLDISNPANPTTLGGYKTAGSAYLVALLVIHLLAPQLKPADVEDAAV